MDSEPLPLARTDQLIVKDVDDEVLVYDLTNDQAHCLNKTAATVWKNCDGKKSIAEIKKALTESTEVPLNDAVIWMALDELEKFNLMRQVPPRTNVFAGVNRRQMMRTLGVAAVALPVIVSLVAPTSASAASCVNPGGRAPGVACGSPNQCCSGTCCSSPLPPGCANNTCL